MLLLLLCLPSLPQQRHSSSGVITGDCPMSLGAHSGDSHDKRSCNTTEWSEQCAGLKQRMMTRKYKRSYELSLVQRYVFHTTQQKTTPHKNMHLIMCYRSRATHQSSQEMWHNNRFVEVWWLMVFVLQVEGLVHILVEIVIASVAVIRFLKKPGW